MPTTRLLLLTLYWFTAFGARGQDNAIVCFDQRTGRQRIIPAVPVPAGRLRTAHSLGAFSNLAPLALTPPTANLVRGFPFTHRQRAADSFDLLSYPVRTAVKLFAYRGGQRYEYCSGNLVGDRYVLTAAHCFSDLFTRELLFGADSLLVTPAYNNGRDAVLPSAFAIRFYAFKSWVDKRQVTDIALLELDRPIGQTIGWVGLGAYPDPDDYYGPVWHKFSYPVHDVLPLDRYNGDTLYYEHGLSFADDTWQYVPRHYDAGGGQSGSAFLTTDNRSYWEAHSVLCFPSDFRHTRLLPAYLAAFAQIMAQPRPAATASCLASVQLFPNPVAGQLTVLPAPGSCLPLTLRFTDALGRAVLTRTRQQVDALTVDLGFLAPGVYWVQLEAGQQREVRKLVKVER